MSWEEEGANSPSLLQPSHVIFQIMGINFTHWASDLEILGVNSHSSYFLFATKYSSSFGNFQIPSIVLIIQPQCFLNPH